MPGRAGRYIIFVRLYLGQAVPACGGDYARGGERGDQLAAAGEEVAFAGLDFGHEVPGQD